jgi:hypothetical protein
MVEDDDHIHVRARPGLRATEFQFVYRSGASGAVWSRQFMVPWEMLDQARFPELVFDGYLDREIDDMLHGSL